MNSDFYIDSEEHRSQMKEHDESIEEDKEPTLPLLKLSQLEGQRMKKSVMIKLSMSWVKQ